MVADAERLRFVPDVLDLVFPGHVLEEVADASGSLTEVRAISRCGGVLAIAETRRDADFLPLTGVRRLAEGCGFTFLNCQLTVRCAVPTPRLDRVQAVIGS